MLNPIYKSNTKTTIERKSSQTVSNPNIITCHQDGTCCWNTCFHAQKELMITHKNSVEKVTWHPLGDNFVSATSEGKSCRIVLHQLSKRASQTLFHTYNGKIVGIIFHPTKPYLFFASQKEITIFDLTKQETLCNLPSCSGVISTIALHPSGHHLVIVSKDKRMYWYSLESRKKLNTVFCFHTARVQALAFHNTEPLFASSADDGTCQVFFIKNNKNQITKPTLVPIKTLNEHRSVDFSGVIDCVFHPTQPWIFTAGADAKCYLYCN
jgi:ribosome biogenesis protein ERB1